MKFFNSIFFAILIALSSNRTLELDVILDAESEEIR